MSDLAELFRSDDIRSVEEWLSEHAETVGGVEMHEPKFKSFTYRSELKGFQSALTWWAPGLRYVSASKLRAMGLMTNVVSPRYTGRCTNFSAAVLLRSDEWASLAVAFAMRREPE